MIVPTNRLLFWVAAILFPFALIGALIPASFFVVAGAIGLLVLFSFSDALLARRAVAGLRVHSPAIARMSKDREAQIEVRIQNPSQQERTIRFALAMPSGIDSAHEDELITLPAQTEWSQFAWRCRPNERGNHRLSSACLEGRSALGLWQYRKYLPVNTEIRVYPNLMTERKDLAALFLHRGGLGVHTQRQVGRGRDFEKLREYIPGDSFDEVHWKATARRGKPVTKVFQIERTQEVYVIIDASRLSARKVEGCNMSVAASPKTDPDQTSDDEVTVLERFITSALILGLAAEKQGDLFGLLTFSNRIERFLRARNGKAHYSACRDALYTLEPKTVTPDFDEVCTFIRTRLRRRALLIFLTSLDDAVVAESFVRNVELIRRQHLVMVNMLPPPGIAPVFADANIVSLDQMYEHLGGHLLWHNLRELGKMLQRRGVRLSLLKNERLSADIVAQYLSVKQRQLI